MDVHFFSVGRLKFYLIQMLKLNMLLCLVG